MRCIKIRPLAGGLAVVVTLLALLGAGATTTQAASAPGQATVKARDRAASALIEQMNRAPMACYSVYGTLWMDDQLLGQGRAVVAQVLIDAAATQAACDPVYVQLDARYGPATTRQRNGLPAVLRRSDTVWRYVRDWRQVTLSALMAADDLRALLNHNSTCAACAAQAMQAVSAAVSDAQQMAVRMEDAWHLQVGE